MLDELFNLLKPYCKSFDLQYRNEKYRLILDGAKDFTGDTVKEVVFDALDWFDSFNSKTNIQVDNTSAIYKIAGYESDGRE
ncbi:MAG: hypothetical protein ACEQSQ_00100 [Candidatus Paceibacteria bacterium]